MRMKKLAAALLAAALAPTSASAADTAPRLFVETAAADASRLTPEQADRLARWRAEPASVGATVVRLSGDVLGAARLTLNLPDRPARTVGRQVGIADAWRGGDARAGATLVRGRDGITGSLRLDDRSYGLRPLGGGLHALVEQNFSRLPPDHPPGLQGLPVPAAARPRAAAGTGPVTAADTAAEYRVLVAYTRQAETAVGDMAGLAALAVAETNTAYTNSRINTRARLAGLHRVEGREASGMEIDLAALQRRGDGRFDYVHNRRDQLTADVVVMITAHQDYCGIAYLDASEAYAFGVVSYACATGYYSFAHEIGHVQGARHNPEVDPSNTPYPYGHGYYDTTARFRTVMSYECPVGCQRIQNFSNPAVGYQGRPTGTATRHDNARLLNETAGRVANFRITTPSQ